MLLSGLVYTAVLASLLIILNACVARSWREAEWLVAGSLAAFGIRLALALTNAELVILEEKAAGDTALNLYYALEQFVRSAEPLPRSTFWVFTFLNLPGFIIAGPAQETILITNAFLGAAVGIPAFYYLRRFDERAAWAGLLFFVLYPAQLNFSLFGLRDVAIFCFMSTFVLSSISLAHPEVRRASDVVVAALSGGLVLLQRAELLPIMAVFPAALLVRQIWQVAQRERTAMGRFVLVSSLCAVGIVIGSVAAYHAQRIVARQIGMDSISVSAVTTAFAVSRMERSTRQGHAGESNILPPRVYTRLDPVTRTALQVAGIIILPYPWLITNVARALAALDSAVLLALLFIAVRYARKHGAPAETAALLAFVCGVLMLGLVVSNAGNAFRMRMAIVPFVLVTAALGVAHARRLAHGEAIEPSR